MSLSDFLGETAETKIVDFLIENRDLEYNQTELAECTGLSRTTIHDKLPLLIYNKLVKISRTVGRSKLFQIEDNDITDGLIKAIFANSFMIAEEEMGDEEAFGMIQENIRSPYEEEINYTTLPRHKIEFAEGGTWRISIEIPKEAFGKEPYFGDVPMMTAPTSTSGEEVAYVRYKPPRITV